MKSPDEKKTISLILILFSPIYFDFDFDFHVMMQTIIVTQETKKALKILFDDDERCRRRWLQVIINYYNSRN